MTDPELQQLRRIIEGHQHMARNLIADLYDDLQRGGMAPSWRQTAETLQSMVDAYSHHMAASESHADDTKTDVAQWTRCSERFPTESDADCEYCVWLLRPDGRTIHRKHYKDLEPDIHADCWWMPTGLTIPKVPTRETYHAR